MVQGRLPQPGVSRDCECEALLGKPQREARAVRHLKIQAPLALRRDWYSVAFTTAAWIASDPFSGSKSIP
jgi:hypothetical protein